MKGFHVSADKDILIDDIYYTYNEDFDRWYGSKITQKEFDYMVETIGEDNWEHITNEAEQARYILLIK
jgi:hypothetical protein